MHPLCPLVHPCVQLSQRPDHAYSVLSVLLCVAFTVSLVCCYFVPCSYGGAYAPRDTESPCAAGLIKMMHCGSADGRSGAAVLAACAARRWLARSAAIVKVITSQIYAAAPACTGLVSCLPALEDVQLCLCPPVVPDDLGCLLEALAWCPRLRALNLFMSDRIKYIPEPGEEYEELYLPFPARALAHLSSLTSLVLAFDDNDPYSLADVVGALVALTDLAQLSIGLLKYANTQLVPAALGQLKALRFLHFCCIQCCVLEPGCFELPNLQTLKFSQCCIPDAEVLHEVGALVCLTAAQLADPEVQPVLYPRCRGTARSRRSCVPHMHRVL